MSALHESLEPRPDTALPTQGSFAGVIASTPTDLAQKVMVTIAAFDPGLQFGPARWQARDAVSLPARGDRCLVVFDEHGEPWIPLWWPYAT